MPLTTNILHERLWQELGLFYPSVCSIRSRTTPSVSPLGEAQAGFPTLTGHDYIACRLSTRSGNTQEQASEVRTADSTYTSEARHCGLDGYYPQITTEMVAVVDGVEYDIEGVVHDGTKAHTKLMLELITP